MTQSSTVRIHKPLTERERWLTSQIMDIAIGIHRFLGPGLLESVYEKCFYYELTKRNIPYLKQKCIELIYDNLIKMRKKSRHLS